MAGDSKADKAQGDKQGESRVSGASESSSSGAIVPGSPTHGELSSTVAQLTKLVAMQSKQLQTLVKLVEGKSHATDSKAELIESLANTIERFSFDPDNGGTFDAWYARFEDVLCEDTKALDDSGKVRLLLHRLDSMAHQRYCHYILPALPKDKKFAETVEVLKKLFKKPESEFCLRWKCLQVAKKETEDFTAYTATVNKLCEDFKINRMTADEFKCLIFILGLKNPKEADIRSRLHNKMDSGVLPAMTLNALAEEAARLVNLKHDTKLGSAADNHRVNNVNSGRGR